MRAVDKPFKVRGHTVSAETVKTLLCDAFEGGSGYWAAVIGETFGGKNGEQDFGDGGKYNNSTPEHPYWHRHEITPLHPRCSLTVQDEGGSIYVLDRKALQRGLELMHDKYSHHWADVIEENDDATTGDVFLQLSLLGDVVYG